MKQTFILFMLLVCITSVSAIDVGVKSAPPFVIIENGQVRGYSIDLMNLLTDNITYKIYPDLTSHLQAVRDGEVDFGIAATTITAKRSKTIDFSQPFYKSSIGIVIPKQLKKNIFQLVFTDNVKSFIYVLFIYLLFCAHTIWLIERGNHIKKNYIKGVAQGVWWTIVTMSGVGYGDIIPKRGLGKTFGIFVILSGIILFGFAIAGLSSMLTINEITVPIGGHEDLVGQPVGALTGTQSVNIGNKYNMNIIEINNFDEGVEMMNQGKITAIIHDTPILKFYINNNPEKNIMLIDSTFEPSFYGISFPKNSPYYQEINYQLLKTIEEGKINSINKKWFGS